MGNAAVTSAKTNPITESGVPIQKNTLYTLEIILNKLKNVDIEEVLKIHWNIDEKTGEPDYTRFIMKMLETPGIMIEFGRFKESGFKFEHVPQKDIANSCSYSGFPFPSGTQIVHTNVDSTLQIKHTRSQQFVVRFFVQ